MQTSTIPVTLSGAPHLAVWERRPLAGLDALSDPEVLAEVCTLIETFLAARLAAPVEDRTRQHPNLTYIEVEALARLDHINQHPETFAPISAAIEAIFTDRIEPIYPVHPGDLAAGESPRAGIYRSCQSHCCSRHGCKYRLHGCPVKTKQVTQDHPCEQCTWEIDDAARYDGSGYSKPGEIGYSVIFALKRDSAAKGEEMADMPTDEQVNLAVKQALDGLTVNGWTLTRLIGADTTDTTDDDE